MEKSADAFRTISEVADDLTLPQHVLRFWETRFPQIRPLKRAGGRRYYRPADIVLLKTIRQLLYDDGYTIKGVQRLLKEQGPKALTVQEPVVQESIVQKPPDLPTVHGFVELHEPMDDVSSYAAAADLDAEGESELQREALVELIATIDDCLRILATARRTS